MSLSDPVPQPLSPVDTIRLTKMIGPQRDLFGHLMEFDIAVGVPVDQGDEWVSQRLSLSLLLQRTFNPSLLLAIVRILLSMDHQGDPASGPILGLARHAMGSLSQTRFLFATALRRWNPNVEESKKPLVYRGYLLIIEFDQSTGPKNRGGSSPPLTTRVLGGFLGAYQGPGTVPVSSMGMDDEEFHVDADLPGYVEDGERFDRPTPGMRIRKIVRTVAALVLASMLVAAGTPISWVTVATAILMFLIWIEIGRRPNRDDHDVI